TGRSLPSVPWEDRLLLTIFATTLFVSSLLLFLVQPMIAKILLSSFGGAPVVWNTCMVFFQAMLLTGYAYAHSLSKYVEIRRQLPIHVAILLLAFTVLPIGLPAAWAPNAAANPVPWLLLGLFLSVGVPFFAVSTSAPLLQRWFAHTDHPSAHNPYFLYGVSNLGGLIALLGYPILIEPFLTIIQQTWSWSAGFVILAMLTIGCAVFLARSMGRYSITRREADQRTSSGDRDATDRPSNRQRAHWLILSFVPSSLLLGVTSYLTTDIAAFPLLWVVPLSLYLTTFVLVFARRPLFGHNLMVRVQPILILPLVVWLYGEFDLEVWQIFLVHLVAFFAITMVCHGELAESRPPVTRLTEFYLWMSAGGILGGLFNTLLSPMIFSSIVEYPLVIALACLLRRQLPPVWPMPKNWRRLPVIAFSLLVCLLILLTVYQAEVNAHRKMLGVITIGILCYVVAHHRWWFAAAVAVVLLAGSAFWVEDDGILYKSRSYFGVHRVESQGNFNVLYHGNTVHGAQNTSPGRRFQGLTYYFPSGPVGQIFDAIPSPEGGRRAAVIGLGAGSLACYGKAGESWTFFEIDPVVERIAKDPRYFTYLRDCPPTSKVVLGDARLSIRNIAGSPYDMIFVDAFSSDAIPVHLITREAVKLYISKLSDQPPHRSSARARQYRQGIETGCLGA
ncbi:MAG: fused MFS/spermidine synthase, partial [Verrucomicrobia bacterium]|nr:fused MFS/spermidine synthase [Verrucomicrobiota bacterium]